MMDTFTRSHVAQSLLYLDGAPISFHDYPYAPAIFDTGRREILMKTGRQVGKTVNLASLGIIDGISKPHFKTLYISPSKEQTSKFSNTRLTKILRHSPAIRKKFVEAGLTNNVLLQILSNGSEFSLSYADDDPDRIRGISADRELIDEVQDIVFDAVIPVVKECMANSDYGYTVYAGTPKSMENTIEFLWQRSSMCEWIMKCDGCNQWQFVESIKSIGSTGVICLKCGKKLNVRNGKWYSFNPDARIHGFHVPQPILPKNNEVPERWDRLIQKMEDYSPSRFNNEVLGISDTIGTRYISKDELFSLCEDYFVRMPPAPNFMHGIRAVSGGVDWSGGGELHTSRTVAWVFGLTEDYRMKTLYQKIFTGDNPISDVDEVADIFNTFRCRYVIGDAGEGHLANAHLRDKLGAHRVGAAQYGGGSGFQALIKWSKQAKKYLVNRTAAIDSYMRKLKERGVIYSNLRQMLNPIQDVLNEYEEVTTGQDGAQRKVWNHSPANPDDALHAQVFAWLAMKVIQGDLEFYEEEEAA